jgi:Na+-driven multidrug efflux pump
MIDLALAFYILCFGLAFLTSYTYGSYKTRKTGLIFPQFFIALIINVALDVLVILGWFFFTWRVNEFLFFGGLALGGGLLVVSEVILLLLLLLRRKKFLKIYKENAKTVH